MPAPKGHPPYNKNGEGGRPKIYTDEFIENEANALEEWLDYRENMFIEDFAYERGYDEDYPNIWAKSNERFYGAYKKFKARQKTTLFKGGLSKKLGFPMCALILSHYHGIHSKQETINVTDAVADKIKEHYGSSKDLVNDA